jgi:hypothetical protein
LLDLGLLAVFEHFLVITTQLSVMVVRNGGFGDERSRLL